SADTPRETERKEGERKRGTDEQRFSHRLLAEGRSFMAPTTTHRTRVRPSPNKSKSPRRRAVAAGFEDSDNDGDACAARYLVSVRSAKNLKREGFRGLTNPYCQLNVGRQGPYTTDVVFDSVNPSWENKRQTFEFREGKGPQEDKLTLACFNSGDVPELIGRLSVALSQTTHKVISLPMFRKDHGGSQVWAGSVEIELHYIPEGESGSPPIGAGRGSALLEHTAAGNGARPCATGHRKNFPPLSPCSASLASSFVKAAASSLPDVTRDKNENGGSGSSNGTAVQEGGRANGCSKTAGMAVGEHVRGAAGGGAGSWKAFLAGMACSAVLGVGALWTLDHPLLLSGQLGLGLTVVEDDAAGRQTVVHIHGSRTPWLADRHLVVFVGEQEVCRGGVPAPAPPTEGSSWAYDLWSLEAADGAAGAADAGKGRGGRGGSGGTEHRQHGDVEETVGGRWTSFARRLAAPLYAAR
ncbi:unnamed protein product, partial [Scytosiphon promiscuus]